MVKALNAVDTGTDWYFWTGNGKPVTSVAHWQKALQTVFELAKVNGAHSHRFRDSFAVSLLEKGVSIKTVSMLLGHSDIRITLRHYRPWVKRCRSTWSARLRRGTEK